jgi:hypothetical protein
MTKSRTEELVEIANRLSNEDLCDLINMVKPRISVWTKDTDGVACLLEVEEAFLNGCGIDLSLQEVFEE